MVIFNSYVSHYQRVSHNFHHQSHQHVGLCSKLYWLVVEPYLSENSEFVSWDDEIPNISGK